MVVCVCSVRCEFFGFTLDSRGQTKKNEPLISAGKRTPDFCGQTLDVVVGEAEVAHVHEVLNHLRAGLQVTGVPRSYETPLS